MLSSVPGRLTTGPAAGASHGGSPPSNECTPCLPLAGGEGAPAHPTYLANGRPAGEHRLAPPAPPTDEDHHACAADLMLSLAGAVELGPVPPLAVRQPRKLGAPTPTAVLPGPWKAAVLARRRRLGQHLWHAEDATEARAFELGLEIGVDRNGARFIKGYLVQIGVKRVPPAPLAL